MERDQRIGIRCTKAERLRWERAAAKDKRTLADWIRLKLDEAVDASRLQDKQQKGR